ncbi:type II toxin-antitoxin system ParD family antitoxin [Cyanothece sp. BG0011]|uniref:type II toxin-antitoxin system ParD family antitoxin n=1 Tax=Cyanothece sp. BG0011 TaxID=2082950 RepID=UPI000D1F60DB|nr:type II toxin-antitoxin system ParD family antitoxin [Cyanothece sp. BG0011]
MNISLTQQQENIIKRQVQTGKYHSPEEVIEVALRLLDEYEQTDAEWIKDIRQKIDDAILESEKSPPVDGETFINQIIDRFQNIQR